MQLRNIIIATSISFIFASCTKEIDIDLNSSSPQLVIEGSISDEPGPYTVRLSKTVNFSEPNSYPPVTDALVIITDNTGVVDTLTEPHPGHYETSKIVGTQGNTYTLSVFAESQEYHAVSKMPAKVSLDSIQFNPFDDPGEEEETYAVVPLYQDPPEFGNCYRFFFAANGITDPAFQVGNDNIANGNLNQQPYFGEDVKFFTGDTIEVSMLCIDVPTYNYYYTLSQISGGSPIGGATPSNPPGNIEGENVLGVFSAFTLEKRSAVVR